MREVTLSLILYDLNQRLLSHAFQFSIEIGKEKKKMELENEFSHRSLKILNHIKHYFRLAAIFLLSCNLVEIQSLNV